MLEVCKWLAIPYNYILVSLLRNRTCITFSNKKFKMLRSLLAECNVHLYANVNHLKDPTYMARNKVIVEVLTCHYTAVILCLNSRLAMLQNLLNTIISKLSTGIRIVTLLLIITCLQKAAQPSSLTAKCKDRRPCPS